MHMRLEEKRAQMLALCRAWEESGQTREVFCKAHGINPGKLSYWRGRHLESRKGVSEEEFIAIKPEVLPVLEIRYPNGVIVTVPSGTAGRQLRSLIYLD